MAAGLDIIGLIGFVTSYSSVGCTPDISALSFGMKQVALAAGSVLRQSVSREGLEDASETEAIEDCAPFQHVEHIVPESVVDGILIPSRTTHLFRFHSGIDLKADDAVYMRVGNYPGTFWQVVGEPARTTWRATVCEAEVVRLIEAEEAMQDAI